MSPRIILFMIHAATLQVIVLVLRVATSYQALGLGLSPLEIGAVSASFALFPILLSIPIGRMLDRRGEGPALAGGALLLLGGSVGFLVLRETALGLTLCTMMLGLGHFLSMVGQHSYIAANVAPERRDAQFGWYAAAISLGQTIGPLLVAFPSEGTQPDMSGVFTMAMVIAIGHVVVMLPVVRGMARSTRKHGAGRGTLMTLMRIPGIKMAILTGIAVMAAMDLLAIYMPVLGAERHIDAAIIASLLSVRAAATLLSRLSYGFLVTRLTRNAFLGLTIGGAGLGVAMLAVPAPLPFLFLALILTGFGLGAALPITLSWITDIAPIDDRGTVFSLRQSALRVSQLFIPIAGGGLAVFTGVAGVFLLLAAGLCGVAIAAARK